MSAAPLPTLLSQVLVAFTIEVDSEFEHEMPHRTTRGTAAGSATGPWLTSLVMWANFMQYVDAAGVPLCDLEPNVAMTNLAGLQRWRYVSITPDPADSRPKPPRADWLVTPTRAGRQAQRVWQPLPHLIESRWRERFGAAEVDAVRDSLQLLANSLATELPDYLPIVIHDLFTAPPEPARVPMIGEVRSTLDLSTLLSRVLLEFTLEIERDAAVSLPIAANLLRILATTPVRVRDLPRLSGISKEATSWSLGVLERGGFAVIEPDRVTSRGKAARLTTKGMVAKDDYLRRLDRIETGWKTRFGTAKIFSLRRALENLVGAPDTAPPPLLQHLTPYADGWRTAVRTPETLPHHPMVLHRGGFPDGS